VTHDQNWPPPDYTQYVVEASALNRNGQGPALSYHEWKDRQRDRYYRFVDTQYAAPLDEFDRPQGSGECPRQKV